jgi:oligoribonuclease (3'-5' exoribonuclease)
MNDWCKEHHGRSGLTQRVRESATSLAEAEQQVGGRMGLGGAVSSWGRGGRPVDAPCFGRQGPGSLAAAQPQDVPSPPLSAAAPPTACEAAAISPAVQAPRRRRECPLSLRPRELHARQVLEFVKAHTEYKSAQLAGNSVHVDRMFLQRHMPALLEHVHYRIVDVSSFSEVARCAGPRALGYAGGGSQGPLEHVQDAQLANTTAGARERPRPRPAHLTHPSDGPAPLCPAPRARSRWAPKLGRGAPRKKAAHTAMSDIQESLAELRYYKERLFKSQK